MKKIFKKNQIIITVLALMIAVAGYIAYTHGVRGDFDLTADPGIELEEAAQSPA